MMRAIGVPAVFLLVLGLWVACGGTSGSPGSEATAGSGGSGGAGGTGGSGGAGGAGGSGGGGGTGGVADSCGDGIVGLGEACDDGNKQPSDGCSPTCKADPGRNAPIIIKAAYFKLGPASGVIPVQASYTGKSIARVRIDFLNTDGSTALADTDGDGVGDHAHIEFPVDAAFSYLGQFVTGMPATTLVDEAKQLVLTLTDDSGRRSAPTAVLEGPQPIRKSGEACDFSGVFDVCEPGTSCRITGAAFICG